MRLDMAIPTADELEGSISKVHGLVTYVGDFGPAINDMRRLEMDGWLPIDQAPVYVDVRSEVIREAGVSVKSYDHRNSRPLRAALMTRFAQGQPKVANIPAIYVPRWLWAVLRIGAKDDNFTRDVLISNVRWMRPNQEAKDAIATLQLLGASSRELGEWLRRARR